jgi:hypothetical protein
MCERGAFQWWYGWHAGMRRAALQCLLLCALIVSARSASALEESDAGLLEPGVASCDPDALASGAQIECERPPPAPVLPPDAGEAPMCDETGASVAARIVIPEVDRGRLEALPCELVLALFGGKKLDIPRGSARWGHHRPPAEPTEITLARADAALAAPLPMPERAEPRLQRAPAWMVLSASSGYLQAPYRPPLG